MLKLLSFRMSPNNLQYIKISWDYPIIQFHLFIRGYTVLYICFKEENECIGEICG
jgi:hypothetical protein